MRNRIREFRKNFGLSQHKLAELVGASPEQIQRFETGWPIKLVMATSIAQALQEPLVRVFPECGAAFDQASLAGDPSIALNEKEIEARFLQAGIEVDPMEWTARVLVRGQKKARFYRIGIADKDRVERILQDVQSGAIEPFIVFEAEDRDVAINPKHVLFWQNLFDTPRPRPENQQDQASASFQGVSVFLAEIEEALNFGAEPDCNPPGNPEQSDAGQFRTILKSLQSAPQKSDFLSFNDEDHEIAHIRTGDIAILEIARELTHPSASDEEESLIADTGEDAAIN